MSEEQGCRGEELARSGNVVTRCYETLLLMAHEAGPTGADRPTSLDQNAEGKGTVVGYTKPTLR